MERKDFKKNMKNWLKNINRYRGENFSRSRYLRLDKNERVINFPNYFLKLVKKKISSYDLSAYPDIERIYKLLSKLLKIPKEMIVLTAGSDIAIKTCFELFTEKNKKIITITPTFGMIDVYSKLYNLKQIKINYKRDLTLDTPKLLKSLNKNISLVIIANPNSPTGTIIEKKILINLIKKMNSLNVPILLDEAYFGFYNNTYIKYVKKYKNLIIARTFSKSFGLAGIRMGYLVANTNVAKNLYKYKPMYEINSIGCLILEIILKNKKILNDHINQIKLGKKYFIQELNKMKIEHLKTYGNFIHINLGKKINNFESLLKKNGILVRKGPGVTGYENFQRITLGSKEQMQKLVVILKKYFNNNKKK